MERRFALIGHRAQSGGKLPLNDLAGAAGRMDVLVRAVNVALFLSHGIRTDSHVTLHLMGGPGPPRRIWFDGSRLQGVHPDERAIAGQIAKVLREPVPAIGDLVEIWPGLWHSGGNISTTIAEWQREQVKLIHLDAAAPRLWGDGAGQEGGGTTMEKLGFFLSDDKPFTAEELQVLQDNADPRSLGDEWLQGHACIAIIHQILDMGVQLNLSE
jgi:tRNA (pseudouridine54-N1)-methyltransferase